MEVKASVVVTVQVVLAGMDLMVMLSVTVAVTLLVTLPVQ